MKIITFRTPSGTREVLCPYTAKAKVIEWLREFYPFSCKYVNENEI